MKNQIKSLIILSLSVFLFFSISNENVQAQSTVENNQQDLITPNENTMRPYKIWVTAERSFTGSPPLTIQHQVSSYGAIYRGTLSLQKGYYVGGWYRYAGYVYNTNNNYRPLIIEQTK